MLFDVSVDIREDSILQYDGRLLELLLCDKSTGRNIIWATDDYAAYGEAYQSDREILTEFITGEHAGLIRPRIAKTVEEQGSRTRGKAEVFTPCWVCNVQNNLVDEQWFGRKDVFNREDAQGWSATTDPIAFPGGFAKTWKKYVDAQRMEITCGEAPYLVSRYDTVTGELLPIERRIGLLDRKLRVVNENAQAEDEWFKWALRSYQSVYGFEYQGDNLLLARENLLMTFIEYYQQRFDCAPSKVQLRQIANVIAWNIWQMDGLKYVVPESCHEIEQEVYTFFGIEKTTDPCPGCQKGNALAHNGVYCRIKDWRSHVTLRYIDMMKGGAT